MHHLPWPYPRILAHRGGGTLAPENTLAAIDVGRAYGYRGVEFDAMLSADAVPVLIHDPTLERTTGARGAVSDRSAAELTALDAGAWHSPAFAGVRLPSFEAAVRHCRAHGLWINIEIKPAPGHETQTGTVVAQHTARLYADCIVAGGAQAAHAAPAVPLFSSFQPQALAAARVAAPDVPRGLLLDRIPDDWRRLLQDLDAVALHTNHRHLTAERARWVKEAGYWLFCYTVNSPERAAEITDWGVDAFCTDRIDLIAPDGAPRQRA